MDKQKLFKILRKDGVQMAIKSALLGCANSTFNFFNGYMILLSGGEIFKEELVFTIICSIILAVYFFGVNLFFKVIIMSSKKWGAGAPHLIMLFY